MITLHPVGINDALYLDDTLNDCDTTGSSPSNGELISVTHGKDDAVISTKKEGNKRLASNNSYVELSKISAGQGIVATTGSSRKRSRQLHGFRTFDVDAAEQYEYELLPLKYSKVEDDLQSSRRIVQSSSGGCQLRLVESQSQSKNKKRCHFNEIVLAITIPGRYEYTQLMKSRLWFDALELYMNATRNKIEYMSEGCNWKTVVEEDSMISCHETGSLIHPVHCHGSKSSTTQPSPNELTNASLEVDSCSTSSSSFSVKSLC